jgi:hypothetical protein
MTGTLTITGVGITEHLDLVCFPVERNTSLLLILPSGIRDADAVNGAPMMRIEVRKKPSMPLARTKGGVKMSPKATFQISIGA